MQASDDYSQLAHSCAFRPSAPSPRHHHHHPPRHHRQTRPVVGKGLVGAAATAAGRGPPHAGRCQVTHGDGAAAAAALTLQLMREGRRGMEEGGGGGGAVGCGTRLLLLLL
eukprot:1161606-Pelagomonas_calceolata.AAC.6